MAQVIVAGRNPPNGQFGTFDGRDNRRELMRLFERLGKGVSEEVAAARRANVLQRLLGATGSPLAKNGKAGRVSTVESYMAFVGITGVLGLDIEKAALEVEREAKRQ